MRIIEIISLQNGAHLNQTTNSDIQIPEGWALIPENIECENFPFGDVEVAEIDGIITVTKWIPGIVPKPDLVIEIPSQLDLIEAQVTYTAMMTDTLLEV